VPGVSHDSNPFDYLTQLQRQCRQVGAESLILDALELPRDSSRV
jgi:hypothetical protein